jgi:hypothetical protein
MTFASFVFEDISWRIIKSQSFFSKRTLWKIYVNAEYLITITNFILLIRFSQKKRKKKKKSQNSFSKRTLINIDLSEVNIIYRVMIYWHSYD